MSGEYIVLDNQQAAALFRSAGVSRGCQYEQGAMRWWLAHPLRIELHEGEWRLYLVPTR